MNLRVAAIQMPVSLDVSANAAAIRRALHTAQAAQADILLTPEGALSGYTPGFDPLAVEAALADVTALARQYQVGLALGTCFKEADGLIYDELRFYAPGGAYLGFHSKILRCGTLAEPSQGEINDYAVTPLRTFSFPAARPGLTREAPPPAKPAVPATARGQGSPPEAVQVGGLICNDLWANPQCTPMPDPHLTHQLAGMGARVVFHAVNGGRDESEWSRVVCWNFHESNLRMRAAASGLWIVTVDSSGMDLGNRGQGLTRRGQGLTRRGQGLTRTPMSTSSCSAPGGVINPKGEWVCRAEPQGEQFFVYTMEGL